MTYDHTLSCGHTFTATALWVATYCSKCRGIRDVESVDHKESA